MADKVEIRARLEFRKEALKKLREAYIALLDGGVKSYSLENRSLTRFDLPDLKKAIEDMEKEIDELEALLDNRKPRWAFAVISRE
ncbi:MAG: hypothetical protein K2O18_07155 [Oscillospiraceae bacterium]|nr:hypothetical protein [Oscillospiraceae bacterium]